MAEKVKMIDGLFDDLLGGPDHIEPAPTGADFSLKTNDAHEIQRGVTLTWLCTAFTIGKTQALSKLSGCPAIRTGQGGAKIYDLRVAAAYLVRPKLDVATYIKNLDPSDLPEKLKREFWAARLAEQRWKLQAGELWRSEDVIAVFGEVFKLIKSKTQLWSDTVDTVEELSDLQRETITDLVNDLLSMIFASLEELERGNKTLSIAGDEDDQEEAD